MRVASVVLICHKPYELNGWLSWAIASIDAQTLPFAQKILAFDSLEGPSIPIPDDWRIVARAWRCPNRARNAGLALVDAGWACFWDGDNAMRPDYHSVFARQFADAPALAVYYPDVQELWNGERGHLHRMPLWSLDAARKQSLCDSGSFWRVSAVRSVGGWKETQRSHDDYELALRLFRAGWKGCSLEATLEHNNHAASRGRTLPLADALWTAWSFAFVTLWGGAPPDAALDWLERADIPPQSFLYWVDNSGGKLTARLEAAWARLRSRFKGLVLLSAGEAYRPQRGEAYLTVARHAHVAALYNQVLPRIREEMIVTLEDDMSPPRDGLRRLHELMRPGGDVAIASGVYRSRTNPDHICAARNLETWRDVPKYDALPPQPFRVGMTGGGFALMANWAIQPALPMRCELTPDGRLMGWDGNLGLALTAAGARLMAHPGVRCEHLCAEVRAWHRRQVDRQPFQV